MLWYGICILLLLRLLLLLLHAAGCGIIQEFVVVEGNCPAARH